MKYTTKNGVWKRVSREYPCRVCDRPDWCLYAGLDSDPTAVICARVESRKRCGEAGWLHHLRDDSSRSTHRAVKIGTVADQPIDLDRFAAECFRALGDDGRHDLGETLGVSQDSLERLCVGWSERHNAYTFPMRGSANNEGRRPICGIRLRGLAGNKWSVRGGREGLFLPNPENCHHLIITEGPTDCAALLDLNFETIGRPSCSGGVRLLADFVRAGEWREVTIVADGDEPGRRGADRLAVALVTFLESVRVFTPPAGIKDMRNWKRRGATHFDIMEAIDRTPALQLRVTVGETVL